MGKHERDIVKEAEKIVATLINREELSVIQKKHPFLDVIIKFIPMVRNNYKNIKKAVAVGNTYNSPGDIILHFDNGDKRYLELKFLEKSGYGTLANISQDALTLLGVYNCESWSCFRKRTGHNKEVRRILNKADYPFGKISESDSNSKVYKAAGYLKSVISAGDRTVEIVCNEILSSSSSSSQIKNIAKLIVEIIKMDKASRREYLSILKESQVNKDNLKKFVILLLSGSHTQKILNIKMNTELSLNDDKNYDIYYLYKKTNEIVKEYGPADLYDISSSLFDIDIKDEETNLVVFVNDNDKRINLIRVVFHWKNKFGGIETPCLNIFKC
jgi:hypothetical protein